MKNRFDDPGKKLRFTDIASVFFVITFVPFVVNFFLPLRITKYNTKVHKGDM